MVTAYYLMEMSKLTRGNEDYYKISRTSTTLKNVNQCRICLREGRVPIFGEKNVPIIAEVLTLIADLEISENDLYPKHLCKVCYKFTKDAIAFRKRAKLTEESLRKSFNKTQSYIPSEHNYTAGDAKLDLSCFDTGKSEDNTNKTKKFSGETVNNSNILETFKRFDLLSDSDTENNFEIGGSGENNNEVTTESYSVQSTAKIKTSPSTFPILICEVCGENFITQHEYYNHRRKHRDEPSHKYQFRPILLLNNAATLRVQDLNRQKEKCEICQETVLQTYFKTHVRLHDSHPFVCEVCGKNYRRRCTLDNHKKMHSNKLTYKCQLCPYRGRFSSALKSHIINTHKREYIYNCKECPLKFFTKNRLSTHFNRKHEKRQFGCEVCGKKYYSARAKTIHLEAAHLGRRNYICNICNKAFSSTASRSFHQRSFHKRKKYPSRADYLKGQHEE